MCVSFLSTIFVQTIFLFDKYVANFAETYIGLHAEWSLNLTDLNEN